MKTHKIVLNHTHFTKNETILPEYVDSILKIRTNSWELMGYDFHTKSKRLTIIHSLGTFAEIEIEFTSKMLGRDIKINKIINE